MIRARLAIGVPNQGMARSLIKALEPDNKDLPQLEIVGTARQSSMAIELNYDGGIETFISTLDDLLRCLHVARETLDTVHNRNLE